MTCSRLEFQYENTISIRICLGIFLLVISFVETLISLQYVKGK